MTASQPKLTAEQYRQIETLRSEYGLDLSHITFLSSGQPWLNSKTRLALARRDPTFQSIESTFGGYFTEPASSPASPGGFARPGGVQAVHNTTVVRDGRPYTMPGIATIGETLWNGEEADPYELSLSRSIASACDAAGFNPLGRTRPATFDSEREEIDATDEAAEAVQRVKDLKRIHVVARQVGLIIGTDERLYRAFLIEFYRTNTSGAMDVTQRHLLINKLLSHGPAYARRKESAECGVRSAESAS